MARKPVTKSKPKANGKAAPVRFSDAVAARICDHIAGGKSLRSFCLLKGSPNVASVYRWLAANEQFRDQYARAREEQADTHVDEIIDIADTEEDPQRAKVRIDARKWTAAKQRPKKYGDRIVNEHAGPDGGPITVQEVSDIEIARKVAFMLGRAVGRQELVTRDAAA